MVKCFVLYCNFYLHRFCAELPSELQHQSHSDHKLDIHKYTKPNIFIKCDNCSYICNGMVFYCKICEFYIDIKCVSLLNTIKHEGHKHAPS